MKLEESGFSTRILVSELTFRITCETMLNFDSILRTEGTIEETSTP